MVKEGKGYVKERHYLKIMNPLKGQDNDVLKFLCSEKKCEVVIVLRNLTKKKLTIRYQHNKIAIASIQNCFSEWFSNGSLCGSLRSCYPIKEMY